MPDSDQIVTTGRGEEIRPRHGGIVEAVVGGQNPNTMTHNEISLEAAGIEPLWQQIHNLLLAHDFAT
jgi:hypothetical protein